MYITINCNYKYEYRRIFNKLKRKILERTYSLPPLKTLQLYSV